ncbi:hypothetical protein JYT84_00800, partial [bacterium AH-315-M10]|nr:hypothetical protein [bacterium AH-315-M10]
MSDENPFTPPEPTIPPLISNLILHLTSGWMPEQLEIRDPVEFQLHDEDLSPHMLAVGIKGEVLSIRCRGDRTSEPGSQGNRYYGKLGSGVEFRGSDALLVQSGFSSDFEGRDSYFVLESSDWSFDMPGANPIAWITPLGGMKSIGRGNLQTHYVIRSGGVPRASSQSLGHLKLRGMHDYYFVRQKVESDLDPWLVVVPHGEGELDRSSLFRDLMVMRCAMGRNLRTDHLIGVDESLRTVSYLATPGGQVQSEHQTSSELLPVWNVEQQWIVPFFSAASHALNATERLPFESLAHYEDSVDDHLDGKYLKLRVAIETLARRTISLRDEPMSLVADGPSWAAWIDEIEAAARQYASPGNADLLVEQLRRASDRQTKDVVQRAITLAFDSVPPEVIEEIGNWDEVLRTGLVSGALEKRDIKADMKRVQLLRTAFASLVSLAIGYTGPICGWSDDFTRHPSETSFFPWVTTEADLQAAQAVFKAGGFIEDASTESDLWPTFQRPSLPRSEFLDKLLRFAGALGD